MRFKILDNGRVKDLAQNVDFDPRKQKNRIAALRFKEEGDSQLMDIINRIDAAEKAQGKKRMAGDALSQAADDIIGELRDEAAYEEIEGLKDTYYKLKDIDSNIERRWDEARSLAKLTPEQTGDVQLVGNICFSVP